MTKEHIARERHKQGGDNWLGELNDRQVSPFFSVMATVFANIAPKIKLPQPLLVRVTYKRCAAHSGERKLKTIHTLGLRHLNQSIIHKNVRPIRGMISKVRITRRKLIQG